MRTLPSDFWRILDRLVDGGVLAWAVTVEFTHDQALYLTNSSRAFDRGGQTYQPFPLKLGSFTDSGDGDLPKASLSLTNVGRFPMPYLEAGLFDQARVILELAYMPDLALDVLRIEAYAQTAQATPEAVQVILGSPDWFSHLYPGIRWLRSVQFPGIPRNIH